MKKPHLSHSSEQDGMEMEKMYHNGSVIVAK